MPKMWDGRFAKETDHLVEEFHSSIGFDYRLLRQDIRGSVAHVRMLGRQQILTREEAETLIRGLWEVLADAEKRRSTPGPEFEDVHMFVEQMLTEKVGELGKKLHTGRSRNDQVALDCKLYFREESAQIGKLLLELARTLLNLAEEHLHTVMPGYTHLQKAQPVTWAHHMMAYFEMIRRDHGRFADAAARADTMPLGSGALAGTTFPLDREMVREELGFGAVTANSLDAVSDRDYLVEFEAAASLLMMHLSRLCEEIVLWSSEEFGFVTLDDSYATGSSIMPQKKNPDVAELIRGKTGRVYGHLLGTLTMLKGLPLAYNKDMQEDKEALFDTVDTVKKSLLCLSPMLQTMTVEAERMRQGARGGFANATDVADYLAARGVPFREAHAITGRLVRRCLAQGRTLEELTLGEYQEHSFVFGEDIFAAIDLDACVERRSLPGGPAPAAVQAQIEAGRTWLREQNR